MIGESVGAYAIVSELGRGGMGVVYLAEHRHLGWKAAIKFLQPEFSERQDALNRFFTEARAASLIDHDGIVRVLDCDVHRPSGQAYIVMEYLEGHTLREYLAWRGRLSVNDVAAVMGRVADALAAAHAQGIIHRDLKPDNIFVLSRPPGAVKIVDFGVAKLSRGGAPTSTLSGTVIGTPLYMSPEQARGAGTLDGRADIYSLGCILFELLCGRPPFTFATAGEVIAAHLAQLPPTPELMDASVPPQLRELVDRMLAKSPDERPGLIEEVIPTLRAFASLGPEPLSGPGPTAELPSAQVQHVAYATPGRRKWGWLLLPLVAGAVAVLAWRPWQGQVPSPEPAAATATAIERQQPPAAKPEPAVKPEPAPPPPAPVPVAAAVRSGGEGQRPRIRPTPAAQQARPTSRTATRPPRPDPVPRADGEIQLALRSEPAGALVCTPGTAGRLGVTNGSFPLRTDHQRTTLLLYHPGYHIEKLVIPGDENVTRSVRLRPLTDDDLQPRPPCR